MTVVVAGRRSRSWGLWLLAANISVPQIFQSSVGMSAVEKLDRESAEPMAAFDQLMERYFRMRESQCQLIGQREELQLRANALEARVSSSSSSDSSTGPANTVPAESLKAFLAVNEQLTAVKKEIDTRENEIVAAKLELKGILEKVMAARRNVVQMLEKTELDVGQNKEYVSPYADQRKQSRVKFDAEDDDGYDSDSDDAYDED